MNKFGVATLDNKRSNTLALHAFLQRFILSSFYHASVMYGYSSSWSWGKKDCTKNKLMIQMMCKPLYKDKGQLEKISLKLINANTIFNYCNRHPRSTLIYIDTPSTNFLRLWFKDLQLTIYILYCLISNYIIILHICCIIPFNLRF